MLFPFGMRSEDGEGGKKILLPPPYHNGETENKNNMEHTHKTRERERDKTGTDTNNSGQRGEE